MKIKTVKQQMLSDLTTPVSIFLKLRERYAEVLLLESSDYSSIENSQSFICFDSLKTLTAAEGMLSIVDQSSGHVEERKTDDIVADVDSFVQSFSIVDAETSPYSGVFGYTNFDAVRYFDTMPVDPKKASYDTPDIRYDFYRYVIVFDHFYERLTVLEHLQEGQESEIGKVINLIKKQDSQTYFFQQRGDLQKNMSDTDFKQMVTIKGAEAEIHPIAGTFKRTGDFVKDQQLAKELSADPKENAEHTMLVDLARNDLSKHTRNVHVEKYKEVQYFSHVITVPYS